MSLRSLRSATRGRAHQSRHAAGFTLIELILVIVLVSVLAVTAIDRFLYWQERAEKAAMDSTLAAIKMGLQIHLAELTIANHQNRAAEIEQENPVRWLDEPPPNYAGDYRAPVERGKWYFATDVRQLVYVPNNSSYLKLEPSERERELRFQVKMRYEAKTTGAKSNAPAGVSIIPAHPFVWLQ